MLGRLAQLVERIVDVDEVTGSSPVSPTKVMKILAIETSCDETAISIIKAEGGFEKPIFNVLAHTIASQIDIHRVWGGVVPMIAKREHGKKLIPLLKQALKQAKLLKLVKTPKTLDSKSTTKIQKILEQEEYLKEALPNFLPSIEPPKIDAIAVTAGPGLEPALWVGINFAMTLAKLWNLPLVPINHLEGHIYSSLLADGKKGNGQIDFPALALLISGGHTELVLIKNWLKYQVIGRTRDDAVGEAFDKVARLLDLPYPGGPAIAKLAKEFQLGSFTPKYKLPRPMLNSPDFDFSFSGLKTAVLYLVNPVRSKPPQGGSSRPALSGRAASNGVKKISHLTEDDKKAIAYEFQQAVIDVLLAKTGRALKQYKIKTLIIGGGVVANQELRQQFKKKFKKEFPTMQLLLPSHKLSTDNATMIAVAAYLRIKGKKLPSARRIKARGNLGL